MAGVKQSTARVKVQQQSPSQALQCGKLNIVVPDLQSGISNKLRER
jgi:hypothetical protein